MILNFLVVLSLIVTYSNLSLGQNEFARCAYKLVSSTYYCDFTIFNPRGVNNFHTINGTHIATNYNDTAVRIVNNLSGSESTVVPTIICEKFINLQRVSLCDMGIEKLNMENDNSFKKCVHVLFIELCRNNISEITENSFGASTKLQELHLFDNGIKNISEYAFTNLNNLTILWLNGNQISNLHLDVFKSLEILKTLRLNDNKIVTLKFEVFQHLKKLETLHLERNKITTVVSFDVAVPIYYLYLSENSIKQLPEKAFNFFQSLNTLHLHNNTFEVVHANAFVNMPNLRTVRFDNNKINAFDPYFFNITGVMYLNMTRNLCANEHIFDNSTSRFSMRVILAECIDNYENQGVVTMTMSTPTTTKENFTPTTDPNLPQECSDGNYDDRICNLEIELAIKSKMFKDAIDELNSKYYELINRPCACDP